MDQEKKVYNAPKAEKIEFDFREQVVASGENCDKSWHQGNYGNGGVQDGACQYYSQR